MATKKEALEASQQAMKDYIALSGYLLGEEAPNNVNEIPADNPFYQSAVSIAKELNLFDNWENLTYEESDNVIINLLMDYFHRIKTDEEYIPVLTISFKKKS